MQLPARNNSAFTLIELLLVVSIIAIITGSIVPAFSTYMRDQEVAQAVEQVKNDLRSVQNRALTGAMSESTVSGEKVHFWGVRFDSGSETYDYFISLGDDTCPPPAGEIENQGEYRLSDGMVVRSATFADPADPACVFFSFLNGDITEINISGSGFPGPIVVGETTAVTPNCRRIMIYGSGLIRMDDSKVCN